MKYPIFYFQSSFFLSPYILLICFSFHIFCFILENGVFSIPLHKAVTHQSCPDSADSKKSPKSVKEDTQFNSPSAVSTQEATDDSMKMRRDSTGSSLSQSSRSSNDTNHDTGNKPNKDTPSESTSWRSWLNDAKTLLSSSAPATYLMDRQSALNPPLPHVPPIVLQAIEYLRSNGTNSLKSIPTFSNIFLSELNLLGSGIAYYTLE